jgi:hypothetical protein
MVHDLKKQLFSKENTVKINILLNSLKKVKEDGIRRRRRRHKSKKRRSI